MIRWLLRRFDPRIARELSAQEAAIMKGLSCSAISAALGGVVIWFIKHVVDAVDAKDAQRLVLLSLSVIAIACVKYVFARGQNFYLTQAANRLTSDLRIRLYDRLQSLPMNYFNSQRAGNIQSALTNDVNVYQNAVTVVRDAIEGPIKIASGLFIACSMQWQLTLVSLVILPVLAYVIQRNARKMKVAQANVQSDLSNLAAMSQESLQGTRIVKAFSAEGHMIRRFTELVESSFQSQTVAARRVAVLKPLVELIGSVGVALVILVCAWLVKNSRLEVANLTAFLFALDQVNQGFRSLGSLRQTSSQVQAATDRIYREILDVEPEVVDSGVSKTLPTFSGRIEFRDVCFTYPDGTQALRNVNFTLEAGQSLALVGPSGSGKSTIADLLLRFYEPTSGQILFDGVDVRELKTSWIRGQIGVVPQQTFLFAGSIADNIRMGNPEASDQEILDAANAAHASFVVSLPDGFGTELGERGVRVSGGEAQRIAIARAFVRRPTVLLLDEATSNLDAISERAVQEALDELMERRTTLMIAHRLSSAARANQILVLRHGEVIESGTFNELMAHSGAFFGMYQAYSDGVVDSEVQAIQTEPCP